MKDDEPDYSELQKKAAPWFFVVCGTLILLVAFIAGLNALVNWIVGN